MANHTLSKSHYITGTQCELALWYYRFKKELTPEISDANQARFEAGDEIGRLAMDRIPGGIEVTTPYWDVEGAISLTDQLIGEGKQIIYEATAIHPATGAYSRIDILRKVPDSDMWDLIEVKSSTKVADYYLDDVSFQYYVFDAAGYKINRSYLMHIDNSYVRDGQIDVDQLFHMEDITDIVLEKQEEVKLRLETIIPVLELEEEPERPIGEHCFKPFECGYKPHCWHDVPEYSVFNVFTKTKAFKLASEINSYSVGDIPPDSIPGGNKATDVKCYQNDDIYVDKDKLQDFMSQLSYPLYYLDYETINPVIPLYDNSSPYQQIPFQFSLHIQASVGGDVIHHEYLHDQLSDPRRLLAERLVELCGSEGSVVVYNQSFVQSRNKELAALFPDLAVQLLAINNRMVDFLVPFRSRWLYNPSQQGSASIKYVLPAFTDISYDGLEIANGSEALTQYEKFAKGKMSEDEKEKLFPAFSKYCELDTYAMVELEKVLRNYSK